MPPSGSLRRLVLLFFAAVPLLCGIAALILGQDSNWDLRNYHWYNAYAALGGRLDIDMGAAQTPTYYNPLIDVPFFLAASALPAKGASFLLAAVQGCNFILLYFIAARLLRFEREKVRVFAALVAAGVGIAGGGHISVLGTVFYDNVLSLFVFAGVLVILYSAEVLQNGPWPAALGRAAFAGLWVGFAVGLKLPSQIYAVGVCFGLLFVPGPFWRRFCLSFVCGLGIVAGFAAFGGWWMLELWRHFANPLFPYFNDIIHSPWALPESYRDTRFAPKSIVDAATLPFRIFLDGTEAGEIGFRDGRILMAYIALLVTPVMVLLRRVTPTDGGLPAEPFTVRYVMAAFGLSYLTWLGMFDIYRYALPLEMLAPCAVIACVSIWPMNAGRQVSLAAAMLGFMVLTVMPGNWGRIPWGDKMVAVDVPAIVRPGESMVLMSGITPTAFVIPAFPREIPFLRLQSYFVEPGHDTRFNAQLRDRIAGHAGDFYALHASYERTNAAKTLAAYGLELGSCADLPTNLDKQLEFCAVNRAPSLPL